MVQRHYEPYIVTLPPGFRVEDIIKEFPPKIRNFSIDKLIYLLHLMFQINSNKKLRKHPGVLLRPVPINAEILKGIIYDYKLYIDYLIESKVIEKYRPYEVGNTSTQYKFCFKYEWLAIEYTLISRKPVFEEYILSAKFSRRIREKLKLSNNKELHKSHKFLTKWFDGLEFDAKTCLENEVIYPHHLNSIQPFINKCYSFSADERGRFYSSLTRLNKQYRKYVIYNGNPLYCLDIKASQPYLLCKLLEPEFIKHFIHLIQLHIDNKLNNHRLSNEVNTIFPSKYHSLYIKLINIFLSSINSNSNNSNSNNSNSISISLLTMLQKISETIDNELDRERIIYKKLVYGDLLDNNGILDNNGNCLFKDIYDFFGYSLKYDYPERFNSYYKSNDREEFKRQFMIALNSKNNGCHAYKSLKSNFPEITRVIDLIKIGKHNTLALVLHAIESFLVIQIICKRVNREKPKVPIFTIHDAILTTEKNIAYIKNIMYQELEEFTGKKPKITIEEWGVHHYTAQRNKDDTS